MCALSHAAEWGNGWSCSAKWQERNAALEEVDGILRGAGGRVQPGVGNLIPLLKVHLLHANQIVGIWYCD